MDTGVVVAIITAFATVIASAIAAVSGGLGWRTSVLRDVEAFEKLYPLVDSGREEVSLEMLRARIFKKLDREMSRSYENVRRFALFAITYLAVEIVLNFAMNRGVSVEFFAIQVSIAIAYGFAIVGLVKLLERHPASDRNPLYVQAQNEKKMEEAAETIYKMLEQKHMEDGWVSNFYLYEQSKKAEWGYRDSANRDDGGKEQVDRGEDDEKGSDVLHDDLQGERDADDGNATGGVGKDG